jgi:site-specific recombinase XerC
MTQDNTRGELALDAYRRWLEEHDRSAHSMRAYVADVRQFVSWFEDHTGDPFTLPAVTEYDVRAWRDALAEVSKPASVNRKLASLSSLYRWATENGEAAQDPTRHVGGIAQQMTAPKALSEQALTKIMRKVHQAGNPRDVALLELLAATGLRVSEVAALTVGDISIGERNGWLVVRSGKGRKERESNNYLTGQSPVVPLGQHLIKNDAHGSLEIGGNFAASVIDGFEDVDHDLQALAGVGLGHHSWTRATLVKITPWQARVTCGKSRCSMGLYLEQ